MLMLQGYVVQPCDLGLTMKLMLDKQTYGTSFKVFIAFDYILPWLSF